MNTICSYTLYNLDMQFLRLPAIKCC